MAALMSQVLIIHEIHYVIHKHNVMRQAMGVGNNIKVLSAPTCILFLGGCYNRALRKFISNSQLLCQIPFAHNSFISCQIVLKFCTEHGSVTAMLCTKFQNDLISEMDVMNEQNLPRFKFSPSGAKTGRFWDEKDDTMVTWWHMTWEHQQQPWYWLQRMYRSLSSTREHFNYLYHLGAENFFVSEWNFWRTRVNKLPPWHQLILVYTL